MSVEGYYAAARKEQHRLSAAGSCTRGRARCSLFPAALHRCARPNLKDKEREDAKDDQRHQSAHDAAHVCTAVVRVCGESCTEVLQKQHQKVAQRCYRGRIGYTHRTYAVSTVRTPVTGKKHLREPPRHWSDPVARSHLLSAKVKRFGFFCALLQTADPLKKLLHGIQAEKHVPGSPSHDRATCAQGEASRAGHGTGQSFCGRQCNTNIRTIFVVLLNQVGRGVCGIRVVAFEGVLKASGPCANGAAR